jgi:hypothetical protein
VRERPSHPDSRAQSRPVSLTEDATLSRWRWQGWHRHEVQKHCGFEPRTEHTLHGPIVYGLGSGVFTPGNGIRLPVGLPRGGVTGTCRTHNPGDEGSDPSCATNPVSPNGRAAGC